MIRIIGQKHYNTRISKLIASDGQNCFLYKTYKGDYFIVEQTLKQEERDALVPITREKAIELYEKNLSKHIVSYYEAFPDNEH